jgi:hypothetical protein
MALAAMPGCHSEVASERGEATSSAFAPIEAPSSKASAIALAPDDHGCLVTWGGDVYCWAGPRIADFIPSDPALGPIPYPAFPPFAMVPIAMASGATALILASADCSTLGSSIGCNTSEYDDSTLDCATMGDGSRVCWQVTWPTVATNYAGHTNLAAHAVQSAPWPDQPLSQPIPPPAGSPVIQVASGLKHSCEIVENAGGSDVYCWGDDTFGQLGPSTNALTLNYPSDSLVYLVSLGITRLPFHGRGGETATGLFAGGNTTCATTSAGHVYCWGQIPGSAWPVIVAQPSGAGAIGSVAVGTGDICEVAGTVPLCWGDNSQEQLGFGFGTSVSSPSPVLPPSTPVSLVAVGMYSTCVGTNGQVLCQGYGNANPSRIW